MVPPAIGKTVSVHSVYARGTALIEKWHGPFEG